MPSNCSLWAANWLHYIGRGIRSGSRQCPSEGGGLKRRYDVDLGTHSAGEKDKDIEKMNYIVTNACKKKGSARLASYLGT